MGSQGYSRDGAARLLEEVPMAEPRSPRFAFIKASWHADVVDNALEGFRKEIGSAEVDVFDVPGALEIPLLARDLAETGRYAAVVCCAFVVDGGIYHHEFVSSSVLDGMMRAQMDSGIPVLSVVLTPHNFQETEAHREFFQKHFVMKGQEAARAAQGIVSTRAELGK